jgi:integrase
LLELADALDKENPRTKYVDPDGERAEYASGTVYQYINIIKRWYDLTEFDFLTAVAPDINTLAADMDTGDHPESPDGGYSRQTVNKFLSASKAFYHYHDDLEPAHDEIEMFKKKSEPAYDSRDMFTREEVNELRDAMGNPRHRALLEMLIFTGQRIRAIQTLRVKDFDLDGGYYYLNNEVEGLKGATKRGRKRPLFGAREYVRDWLDYHPRSDDPDAWVFVGDPSNPQVDLENPINKRSIVRILKNAAEEAGIEKSVSPHKFRHYFVTVMKRDYDMNDDTIKFLLGHAESSNVMNTTYKHVKNEDYIEKAEVATGAKEPDNTNPHTPPSCPVCGEVLEPDLPC